MAISYSLSVLRTIDTTRQRGIAKAPIYELRLRLGKRSGQSRERFTGPMHGSPPYPGRRSSPHPIWSAWHARHDRSPRWQSAPAASAATDTTATHDQMASVAAHSRLINRKDHGARGLDCSARLAVSLYLRRGRQSSGRRTCCRCWHAELVTDLC